MADEEVIERPVEDEIPESSRQNEEVSSARTDVSTGLAQKPGQQNEEKIPIEPGAGISSEPVFDQQDAIPDKDEGLGQDERVQVSDLGEAESSKETDKDIYLDRLIDSEESKSERLDKAFYREKTKTDDPRPLSLAAVEARRRDRVKALFVYPQDYEAMRKQELGHRHVFIIHGPEHAGKSTCAVHLGLALRGEIPLLTENSSQHDLYSCYEIGANELLNRMGLEHPDYINVSIQEHLLDENIREARQYLDTRELKDDRARIIERLNKLAISILGSPFSKLYISITSSESPSSKDDSRSTLRLNIYNRSEHKMQSLLDFVQHPDVQDDTIYIIEDIFGKGITLDYLSDTFFSILNDRNIFLILTTTYPKERLNTLPSQVGRISAYADDKNEHMAFMGKVFAKYLDYYNRSIPASFDALTDKDRHNLIRDHLKWPFQVEDFYEGLSDLPSGVDKGEILELAEQVGRIEQVYTRFWFERLPYNAKLYAMLVVLFEDIHHLVLDEIYIEAVNRLRQDGVSSLCDPREIGLDDMLKLIRVRETVAGLVRFKVLAFEKEARRQIRNHHHLLWSLSDMLVKYIEEYKAPKYWEFRRTLGTTIGRLGTYHIHKLESILEFLAKNEFGGVVAVAGYALDEICSTGPEYYPFVIELLNKWVDSGDPDLMWAVGASIWRIYDGLFGMVQIDDGKSLEAQQASEMLGQVKAVFTRLAEDFDHFDKLVYDKAWKEASHLTRLEGDETQQLTTSEIAELIVGQSITWAANNMGSILHAVRQIALFHPKDMVEQIRNWLQAEDSNLRGLGLLAGRQLFRENAHPEMRPLAERHLPLLDLTGPLLFIQEDPTDKEETVDTIIRALLIWLKRSEWANQIHTSLLHVVNRSTPEAAAILRASLSRQWSDSDSPEAHHIGRSLFTRSYAIHGFPMDMPGHRYGVIILDASRKARLNQAGMRAGLTLYRFFDSRLEVRLGCMGQTGLMRETDQHLSLADLQADYDGPRLLLPLLEELDLSKTYFILVLTWGAIIDLYDLWPEAWADHWVVASVKGEIEWPEKLRVVSFDRQMTGSNLEAIDAVVSARLARALADLGADDWYSTIQAYLKLEPTDIDAIVTKLESWIKGLDNIEYSRHPDDIARIINCTILWLAVTDLSRCVGALEAWLTAEDELFQLMGTACGKLLFKVYAQHDPAPPVKPYALLLKLAPLLAKRAWSGTESVLEAVRRWAIYPGWMERLLAHPGGEPSELMQLIDANSPENYKALADALKDWPKPLMTEDKESVPQSIINLAGRLQLHLALGTRHPLTDLPEGHSYGLIVIDGSVRDNQTRWDLAKLASNLIQALTEELKKCDCQTLNLLTYRLGQDYPVAGPGERPKAEDLILPDRTNQPRLLGPLLEKFSAAQVSFVLVFSDHRPLLDGEDWHDTVWSERITIYTTGERPNWIKPFASIPWQPKLEEAKKAVLRHLLPKIGV